MHKKMPVSICSCLSRLLLVCAVTACSTAPIDSSPSPTVPETVAAPAPLACYVGATYRDALNYLEVVKAGLNNCNADKESIRGIMGVTPETPPHD